MTGEKKVQRARCYLLGETAVVLELEPPVTLESQKRIWGLTQRLTDREEVVEVIPGMNNITVVLRHPQEMAWEAIDKLQRWWEESDALEPESREISIPVIYGGEAGPDLGDVARHSGLSEKQVVELHSSVEYMVWFLGFQPGFPYFGGLPEQLAMPRRAERAYWFRRDPSVSADRKPVFIRWRRRAAGSCWGARRWHYSIQTVKSRCCCVPAIACALCRRRRGYVEIYPRRHVYLGTGWRPGRPAPVGD
ncbi:hypothetical protein C7D71_21990 [Klebsiella pneumoniae]|nr:hypothetical protein C7D71_21990 [Klebsiella pneumoniae]